MYCEYIDFDLMRLGLFESDFFLKLHFNLPEVYYMAFFNKRVKGIISSLRGGAVSGKVL